MRNWWFQPSSFPKKLLIGVTYQGFRLVCFCSSSCFSSLENCRSSSKELLSRSWMYCSMLLVDLWGNSMAGSERACEELEWTTFMLLNWLRRSSYCAMRSFMQFVNIKGNYIRSESTVQYIKREWTTFNGLDNCAWRNRALIQSYLIKGPSIKCVECVIFILPYVKARLRPKPYTPQQSPGLDCLRYLSDQQWHMYNNRFWVISPAPCILSAGSSQIKCIWEFFRHFEKNLNLIKGSFSEAVHPIWWTKPFGQQGVYVTA